MDTSRTLKGSTLLRSADCLFSVLRPYSERFFCLLHSLFKRLEREVRSEVKDAVLFFLVTSIYVMRPHNVRLANLQKAKKCEILT